MGVRQERTNQLRMLSEKKRRAFYQLFAGESRKVLWEASETEGRMLGYSDNYVRVSKKWNPDQINTVQWETLQDGDVRFDD